MNVTNIFLANDESDFTLPIKGAVPTLTQSLNLEISLPPKITGAAIKKSESFDGTPIVVNMFANSLQDLSGNVNDKKVAIEVVEFPDKEPPVILKSI